MVELEATSEARQVEAHRVVHPAVVAWWVDRAARSSGCGREGFVSHCSAADDTPLLTIAARWCQTGTWFDSYAAHLPQSAQSVPSVQMLYCAPGPPSSQYPLLGRMHQSLQHTGGDGGACGSSRQRFPQSSQSVPNAQSWTG